MSLPRIRFTKRKECTVLTWPSKLIILAAMALTAWYFIFQLPLSLSKNDPQKSGLLVIDGQMPDFVIREAVRIFDSNHYQMIIATGGDLPAGRIISGKKSMAAVTEATLLELGFDSLKLVTIHSGTVLRNRTYSSAVTLRNWLAGQRTDFKNVDILSLGCHAKRSRLLFQKALGENYQVGVWAIPDQSYDVKRWWKTSNGFRTVFSEIIAYLYARFFFFPKY